MSKSKPTPKPKYPDLYVNANLAEPMRPGSEYAFAYASVDDFRNDADDVEAKCVVVVYRAVAVIPAGSMPVYKQVPL